MNKLKPIVMVLAAMLMLSGISMADPNDSDGMEISGESLGVPVITVLGEDPITIQRFTEYVDEGATAVDSEGNDITEDIVTTGTVDNVTVGTYTITYTVTDNFGETDTKTRTIYVEDNTAPADVEDLDVGTVTSTSIEITWSNVAALESPDFTTVLVSVVKDSDGSVILEKEEIGIVESYTITDLEPGTAYTITVYTRDDQP